MVKAALSVFAIAVLFSCNAKTRYLDNNKTKVPTDDKVFGNRSLFDSTLLQDIDTNAMYEEAYSYLSDKGSFTPVTTEKHYSEAPRPGFYRFYPNGNVNFFVLEKDFDDNQIDPEYTGNRGILYKQGNRLKIDLFAIKSYGLQPNYGIITHIIEIKGDTLFEKSIKDPTSVTVYGKRKLTPKAAAYKADW